MKALTEIADFNEALGTAFSDEEFSTIGGLIVSKFGHLPKRGESISFDELHVTVVRADSRRLHSVLIEVASTAVQDVED